jgi:hypothetical protein
MTDQQGIQHIPINDLRQNEGYLKKFLSADSCAHSHGFFSAGVPARELRSVNQSASINHNRRRHAGCLQALEDMDLLFRIPDSRWDGDTPNFVKGVVDHLEDALLWVKKEEGFKTLVTLEGDMVERSGVISGGSHDQGLGI